MVALSARRHVVLVGHALVVALLCCASQVRGAPATLPVDFTVIPTDASAPTSGVPTGCTCLSTASPCTEFDCACVCDLTAGECDANCCCDSECSQAEKDAFTAANACLPQGPTESTVTFCADLSKDSLFGAINPKFRMTNDATTVTDDLMCVAVNNNPTSGSFLADPGTLSPTVLDSLATASATYTTSKRALSDSTAAAYAVGENVRAATAAGASQLTGYLPTGGGSLVVPRAASSGECVDGQVVAFGRAVAASSCARRLTGSLAERCAALDPSAYVGDVRIGKRPNAQTATRSDYVSVAVTSVQIRSGGTGSGTLSAHPTPNNIASRMPTQAGRTNCLNALLSVKYTIHHDGAGVIASASAEVVVANLTTTAGAHATVQQSFQVVWVSDASVDTSFAAGNVIERELSGNPGYIVGKPVLGGTSLADPASTGKTAISAWTGGLAVKGCSGDDVVIAFGESASFGCPLALDRGALEAMCNSKSQLSTVGFDATHVGIYGNADPLKSWEWLEVSKSLDPAALATGWEPGWSGCANVASGLNVEFLTVDQGETGNPQPKIAAARVSYTIDNWAYTARSGPQTFVMRTTVTFTKYTTASSTFVPPAPQLLPVLPNDLFFPFSVGSTSAAPAGARPGVALAVWVACAAAAMALLG